MNRSSIAGLCACLCACGGGTEGRIVQVEVAVQPVAESGAALGSFETATGWQVTLDEAEVLLSAIYGFAPDEEPSAIAQLERLFVPVAHAHGGYDPVTGQRVRVEVLQRTTVDLLAEDGLELGAVEAEAGAVEKFAVEIGASSTDLPAALHGHQAWVSGEARRDGEIVRFEGGLDVPDEALTRRIEAKATDVDLDEGGRLVIGIRPSAWLRDANFDRLDPGEDDAPRAITADNQVGRAWFIGARSPAGISIDFAETGER
jgi:hypothetical protein